MPFGKFNKAPSIHTNKFTKLFCQDGCKVGSFSFLCVFSFDIICLRGKLQGFDMKNTSRLTVPNDLNFIKAVLVFCVEVSKEAGFSVRESGEIALALKEACENVITHAFLPGEDESFTVVFDILASEGLRITIDEMGLPFNFEDDRSPDNAPGLQAIKENMDDVIYINRGKEGKELQLFKYLKGSHVEDIFKESELICYDSCELAPGGGSGGEVTVRLMEPGEAVEVSRCIYRAYRYTYLNEDLYFPKRIESRNRDGSMISCVAVTESGEVVGHFALIPRPNKKTAEIGVAVVRPEYRRRGIMVKMLEFLVDRAMEENRGGGFTALYGNALTVHKQSQKTNLKFGFSETALKLGVFPPGAIKPARDHWLQGAGDVITCFKMLKKAEPYAVYLPARHRDMLLETYAGLGVERDFKGATVETLPETLTGEPGDALPGETTIELTIKPYHKTATVSIKSYGRDLERRVNAKRIELLRKGFNALYVELNLKDPFTPEAAVILEGIGFFYCGLYPEYSEGDVLMLQRENTTVRYDEIKTVSPLAKKIVDYVKNNDPRWKALQG